MTYETVVYVGIAQQICYSGKSKDVAMKAFDNAKGIMLLCRGTGELVIRRNVSIVWAGTMEDGMFTPTVLNL